MPGPAATFDDQLLSPSFIADIDRIRQEWGIKGVSVTVVKQKKGDGFDQWEEQFVGLGVRDGEGNPMEADSLFSIASNSKLFTAIAVGLVIHNESLRAHCRPRLGWETKVKDVVADWKLMDPVVTEHAEVIDLLAHRTGLPNHVHAESHDPSVTKDTIISRLRHLRPSTELQKQFQYSNTGYLVASTIPERLYGIPFTQYVQDHLLSPLGMRDTTYDPEVAARTGRRVDGFVRSGQDPKACAAEGVEGLRGKTCQGDHVNIRWHTRSRDTIAGQGGIISSSRDMATWLKMLLLNGRSPTTNETIVPPSIITATRTPHIILSEPTVQDPYISGKTYGLGQCLYTYRGFHVVDHCGSTPGQMSQVLRVPEAGLGVVVMANDGDFGSTFTEMVGYMVLDQVLGLEPVDWKARLQPELMKSFEERIVPTAEPDAPLPSIPLEDIQGTYFDAAYGKVVVCAVDSTMPKNYRRSGRVPAGCEDILAGSPFEIASIASGIIRPTFVARLDREWVNYLMFEHLHGAVFTVTPSSFYPDFSVSTTTPFGYFKATFTEKGMAWGGNAWGSWPVVEDSSRLKGNVEHDAEVWFDKVD